MCGRSIALRQKARVLNVKEKPSGAGAFAEDACASLAVFYPPQRANNISTMTPIIEPT